ncbi:MAG TPA: chromate resistance protein ChrB domain-containing protein [Pyrinomonadaceae bacterium]|nr:chromate resistance protein ChrB domain-containing protein [Pyrinomonadaceae bacterium]
MKWITRERIRVNRTATCWLIQRFLDSEAELLFVPAEEVATEQAVQGAISFDAPNATYPHKDIEGLCSFAALVHERLSADPVLMEMARIVQAADFKDQLDTHQAARGLELISRGFPRVTKNDQETAKRAAFLYDALYASIAEDRTNQEGSGGRRK